MKQKSEKTNLKRTELLLLVYDELQSNLKNSKVKINSKNPKQFESQYCFEISGNYNKINYYSSNEMDLIYSQKTTSNNNNGNFNFSQWKAQDNELKILDMIRKKRTLSSKKLKLTISDKKKNLSMGKIEKYSKEIKIQNNFKFSK